MTTTPEAAQKTVLFCMASTVGLAYTAKLIKHPESAYKNPGSMIRIAAGGLVASFALMLVAKPEPELARLFAILVVMGAIYTYGDPLFDAITVITSRNGMRVINTGGKLKASQINKKNPDGSYTQGDGSPGNEEKKLPTKPATPI